MLDDFVLTIGDDDVLPGITATDDVGIEGGLLTATFTFDGKNPKKGKEESK